MERLTIDKPISEMNMVELAHNSCFVKNGEAYYRDFDGEISARDLARRLYKLFTSEELSKDNDTFDVEMMEELKYDIEIYPEGVVALLYRNLWAMADIREQLKRYEDKEEQKLLLRLPCKVGDTLYIPYSKPKYIKEVTVMEFVFDGCDLHINTDFVTLSKRDIGVNAFTKKEDALSKLN